MNSDDVLTPSYYSNGEDIVYWKYWAPMGWKVGLTSRSKGELYILQCEYCDGIINVQSVNADSYKISKYQRNLISSHEKECEKLHGDA